MDNEFLLEDRLTKIRSVIKQYGESNFYISFSGGKDSSVLSHLVDMAIPDNAIPRVYANTGIEYNLMVEYVKSIASQKHYWELVIIQPKVNIKQMLEKEGYPFKSKEHSKIVDLYQKWGMDCITVPRYLGEREGYGNRFRCPKMLEYQFQDDFTLKISDKCCKRMKEEPLRIWARKNGKSYTITGMMSSEGGRRATAKCLAFTGKRLKSFNPFAPMTKEWEDWYIEKFNVQLCNLYKEPYNFDRTGCKGCPFALNLQNELDTLEKFFPEERKQCEYIWKPVYDEYRRIGYRLKDKK